MLSGRRFREDELALATDPHPTGSAFKPFVLAAAFEQGVPPSQSYSSASPFCSPLWQDEDHCVSNAEGSGSGKVDLWTATENSINVVFAQLILDIGPETVADYEAKLDGVKTVVWNGPMGVAEWPAFAGGSHALARFLADLDATVIIGGGETVAMVQDLGIADRYAHVSTGGGASLEFLEGRELPGVAALLDR